MLIIVCQNLLKTFNIGDDQKPSPPPTPEKPPTPLTPTAPPTPPTPVPRQMGGLMG